jgi:RNA polymerase sigma factor (sigma-70 family)
MTIARRAAIKRYHSKNRKRAVPSEMTVSLSEIEAFVAGDDDVAEGFDAERLGRVISDFLRSLPTRKQFIFMSRYYSANSIDVIARELNLSRSMINKELASIREDLRIALEKEGYDV